MSVFDIFPMKEATTPASIVSVDDAAGLPVAKMKVALAPVQDLHGYSKPWAAGAGKNLYSPSWAVPISASSTVTVNGEEIHVVTTGGTTYAGMATQSTHDLPAGTYYVKFKLKTGAVTGTGGVCGLRRRRNNVFFTPTSFSSGTLSYSFSVTITEDCYFSVLGNGGSTGDSQASDFTLYDLIISAENVDYEPYENVCPITGWTGANIYVSPTPNVADATTYTVDWTSVAGTVYHVTLDPVTGKLTATHVSIKIKDFTVYEALTNGGKKRYRINPPDAREYASTAVADLLCSAFSAVSNIQTWNETTGVSLYTPAGGDATMYFYDPLYANSDAATFKSEMGETQIVYPLATPVEYQLTPEAILMLKGENNVWLSGGQIEKFVYHAEVEPHPVNGMFVDGKSLQDDGWFMKWRKLAAPQPKMDYTSIYGRDGSIDQTEALGDVFYEDRSINLDMVYIGEDWNDAYSKLLNAIHGQKCAVQFTDDPYWYWAARLVASEFSHKTHSLTMSGVAFPYKLGILEKSYKASVNGATEGTAVELQLEGSRMRVSPKVVVTGSVTLKWGTNTTTLSDGTYYVRGLKVGSEDVTIKVWGTGTVAFEYRKGTL